MKASQPRRTAHTSHISNMVGCHLQHQLSHVMVISIMVGSVLLHHFRLHWKQDRQSQRNNLNVPIQI